MSANLIHRAKCIRIKLKEEAGFKMYMVFFCYLCYLENRQNYAKKMMHKWNSAIIVLT